MTTLDQATIEQLEAALEAKRAEVDQVKVTQADREAAIQYAEDDGEFYVNPDERRNFQEMTAMGMLDDELLVQAFARHRTTATAATDALMREACEALEQCPKWLARLDGHELGSTTGLLVDQINATLSRIREQIGE